MPIKKENEIFAFLVKEIKDVLSDAGADYDFTVTRGFQPTLQALQDKTVYINRVSKRRYGTQGSTDALDNASGEWQNIQQWYEEHLFQVSAFKKQHPETDDETTVTSGDVIEVLMAFFNSSEKVKRWKATGYEVIKTVSSTDLNFETDSGLNEKMPHFDVVIVVEQNTLKIKPKISKIEITTKRV